MAHGLQDVFNSAASTKSRALRAKLSHVPQSSERLAFATKKETSVVRAMKRENLTAKQTTHNAPFDVVTQHVGKEVKTIFPTAKNFKLTMHKSSLKRKKKVARKEKLTTMTAAFDAGANQWYVSKGLGSFRVGSMEKTTLKGIAILASEMTAKKKKRTKPIPKLKPKKTGATRIKTHVRKGKTVKSHVRKKVA
jgi:hypothetical protein